MKKISFILTLSALFASASLAQAAPDAPEAPLSSGTQDADSWLPTDNLPKLALSEELMFKYLSSELAFQRGQAFAAYSTMLSLARASGDSRLARRAVEFAIAGSLTAEALKGAIVWHELAPRSEGAEQTLLSLQLANGRFDEAKQKLAAEFSAATPATLPVVIANVQRQLSRVSDRTKANALFKELIEPYRDTLDAKLALAQLAMVSGDRASALREAREALAKYPKSEVAALMLAQVTENKTEAAKSLADFLQKNPKARDVRIAYSRMLFDQTKLSEAKKEFQTLIQQYPNDQTALYALGLLSVQTNDLKDAETYLSAYIKSLGGKSDNERDSTQALMVLAQISEDRNDTAGALKWLEMVDASNHTNYLGSLMKRAQLQAKSGKLSLARALLSQAEVESDDERVKLIVAEAQLLRDAGQLSDAMKLIEEAMENHKDNPDLLYEHAMLAEKAHQFDVMERSLRSIIRITPANQHAYNALGYSLAERNLRLPEAYDLIKKATELAPDDAFILDSLGWVEFRLGRLEKAEETLRRAYAMKADPEIATHLGEVLWTRGREDEAKKLWRNANSNNPKNETLKDTLQRLQVKL